MHFQIIYFLNFDLKSHFLVREIAMPNGSYFFFSIVVEYIFFFFKLNSLEIMQVSNWFINARVRLWKPMVEEMYMEELKEQENGSEEKSSKSNEDSASKSSAQHEKSPATENQTKSFNSKQDNSTNQHAASAVSMSKASTSPVGGNVRNHSGFHLIGSSELEGITQGSPKKLRSNEMLHSPSSVPSISCMDIKPNAANNEQVSMKFGDIERQSRDGYSFMGSQTNFTGGFGQYPMGDMGRFDAEQFAAPRFSGNSVSLTLGLPHCENLSLSGTHHTFLPNQNIQLGRRVDHIGEPNEFGDINTSNPHSSAAYEHINIQNPKRFAAQLLPDFVA